MNHRPFVISDVTNSFITSNTIFVPTCNSLQTFATLEGLVIIFRNSFLITWQYHIHQDSLTFTIHPLVSPSLNHDICFRSLLSFTTLSFVEPEAALQEHPSLTQFRSLIIPRLQFTILPLTHTLTHSAFSFHSYVFHIDHPTTLPQTSGSEFSS